MELPTSSFEFSSPFRIEESPMEPIRPHSDAISLHIARFFEEMQQECQSAGRKPTFDDLPKLFAEDDSGKLKMPLLVTALHGISAHPLKPLYSLLTEGVSAATSKGLFDKNSAFGTAIWEHLSETTMPLGRRITSVKLESIESEKDLYSILAGLVVDSWWMSSFSVDLLRNYKGLLDLGKDPSGSQLLDQTQSWFKRMIGLSVLTMSMPLTVSSNAIATADPPADANMDHFNISSTMSFVSEEMKRRTQFIPVGGLDATTRADLGLLAELAHKFCFRQANNAEENDADNAEENDSDNAEENDDDDLSDLSGFANMGLNESTVENDDNVKPDEGDKDIGQCSLTPGGNSKDGESSASLNKWAAQATLLEMIEQDPTGALMLEAVNSALSNQDLGEVLDIPLYHAAREAADYRIAEVQVMGRLCLLAADFETFQKKVQSDNKGAAATHGTDHALHAEVTGLIQQASRLYRHLIPAYLRMVSILGASLFMWGQKKFGKELDYGALEWTFKHLGQVATYKNPDLTYHLQTSDDQVARLMSEPRFKAAPAGADFRQAMKLAFEHTNAKLRKGLEEKYRVPFRDSSTMKLQAFIRQNPTGRLLEKVWMVKFRHSFVPGQTNIGFGSVMNFTSLLTQRIADEISPPGLTDHLFGLTSFQSTINDPKLEVALNLWTQVLF